MFKYYFKTFATSKNLFVPKKFNFRRSWSDPTHLGAGRCIWAAKVRARGATSALDVLQARAVARHVHLVHTVHARCALSTQDACQEACARVRYITCAPDGPVYAHGCPSGHLGSPTAAKVSLSCWFSTPVYFKPPQNTLLLYKTFHYSMCDFKYLLAKTYPLNFDLVCLKYYNLVQNFNLTKLLFSWTFNQTNTTCKSYLNFDLVCLKYYNLVQNFNLTKLLFSWTFNQTNTTRKS